MYCTLYYDEVSNNYPSTEKDIPKNYLFKTIDERNETNIIIIWIPKHDLQH